MSKTTQPISLMDYDDGIGREMQDLRGLAVLFENAAEARNSLELSETLSIHDVRSAILPKPLPR